MELNMRVHGKEIKLMEKGILYLLMGLVGSMMETGRKICMMELGKKYEMMGLGIKDNMLKERRMAKGGTNGRTDQYMKGSGLIIIFKDK